MAHGGRVAVADVRGDVRGEAAALAEGEVDSEAGCDIVDANAGNEGWVFGVGGHGCAGGVVEVDEAASAFFQEAEDLSGHVVGGVLEHGGLWRFGLIVCLHGGVGSFWEIRRVLLRPSRYSHSRSISAYVHVPSFEALVKVNAIFRSAVKLRILREYSHVASRRSFISSLQASSSRRRLPFSYAPPALSCTGEQ